MDWKRMFRTNYAQMIFVCAAFALMVLIGCISVGNVLQKEKLSTVTVALDETEKTIRAYLREPKIAFESIYTAVRDMLDRNESQEAVLAYLTQTTNTMLEQEEGVLGFNAVYGYIRGEFVDSGGLNPGEDYIPQQRPWYQLAVRSDGAEYTAPYLDAKTGMLVISLAREIYGANGEYYGVLSMDVDISWLMEYAETLQFAEGGYGMIVNQFIYLIAHPQEQYRNIPLQDLGDGYAEISEMLRMNSDVSAVSIRDIDNTRVITFFKQLYNGWYVGVVMPAKSYYADLYLTAFILAALGIGLMVALNYILLRLYAAKLRSEEENKSKTSFLARMSHEIRTPMNAILGMAELVLREDISITAYEHIQTIKQSGANLLSIINDILDFSKIESGKLEIVTGDYLFASLMNDVINIIRTRVMDSHLRFVANIDSNIPNALIGDEIRIRQVLLNLLSNAVKYTEEGFVSLSVTCETISENTVALTIEVADSGKGIKEEDMDKLFGDFVQIDMLKNKGIEGTGLGLAITQNFVRAMGGDITVRSEYGKGSVFTVTLPQGFRQYEKLASVENPEKKSVLVYERRGVYVKSIEYTVKNLGADFVHVSEEDEFYEAMAKGKFTVVFVSSFLLQNAKRVIARLGSDAKVVLLTEFGETVAEGHLSILTMPIHPVSVANILNGVSDSYNYGEGEGTAARFAAPSARVLIVDDVNTNLKVAEGLMLPYKMRIDICKSGREAIGLVRENSYDIIFMDHMMPEMDGIETTAAIRAMDGAYYREVPIVALTANAISGMREMFLEKKFNDYLSKPIEILKLDEIMQKWIPKEKRLRALQIASAQPDAEVDGLVIEGLDTERGRAMTGGSDEGYQEVLTLYCRDVNQRLEFFEKPPDESGLTLFVTQVHALKSASASIGAVSLAEQAAFLEDAGKRGDMEAIREKVDSFREALSRLVDRICAALASDHPGMQDQNAPVLDKTALLPLKEALEAENIGEIDAILNELMKNAQDSNREAISALSDYVLVSAFDEAITFINQIQEAGNE